MTKYSKYEYETECRKADNRLESKTFAGTWEYQVETKFI